MNKLLYIFILFLISVSCGGGGGNDPDPVDPTPKLADYIKKVWKAKVVKEGSLTVYTEGAANNTVAGYSNFRLDLRNMNSASLKEFDGNTFTGTATLTGETKLTLNGLSPQPSGTNGTLEYTITGHTENELKLSRVSVSAKTGNTLNEYTLIPVP